MSNKRATLAALAASTALFLGSVSMASATSAFPNIGANTGPQILITLSGTNTATITNPGGQGPYDGSDDAYIGVVNNTSSPISTLTLSSNLAIFGFESDGIGLPDYTTYPGNGYQLNCGVCQYGAANSNDTTGYGGPNAYFTNINAFQTQGVVNFTVPIAANGGIDWFALEQPLDAASFTVTSVNGTTPLPAAWVMMLTGLFGGGYLRFRGKQNGTSQVAVA